MKVTFKGQYRSLTDFEWVTKGNLVIITGENGSGKTQLLQILSVGFGSHKPVNNEYAYAEYDQATNKNKTKHYKLEIKDININYSESLTWTSTGRNIPSFPVDYNYYIEFINWLYFNIQNDITRAREDFGINNLEQFNSSRSQHSNTGFENLINGKHLKAKIIELTAKRANVEVKDLTMKDLLCYLPLSFIFYQPDINSIDLLEYYIFFYYMQKLMREHNDFDVSDMEEDPIIFFNEILKKGGLKYVVEPFNYDEYKRAKGIEAELRVLRPFMLKVRRDGKSDLIQFQNVSSGERIIVSLGFMEYYATYMNKAPRLMMLDEIDAHLHPAIIPNLYRVINEILIKKFDTKVIMTTHNPSTIALAPKEEYVEVFKMTNLDKTELIKDLSKRHIDSMNLLTEGLILVTEKTKFIFVEDEDDVEFYSNLNTVNSISNRLIFLPASNRSNKDKDKDLPGGKDAVNKLINRFEALSEVFDGLIDRDSGNLDYLEKLKTINRYSIENYYFDPLVLFSFLNSQNTRKAEIIDLGIIQGKEHEILSNPIASTNIIKYIVTKMEPEVVKSVMQELDKGEVRYSIPISDVNECKQLVKVKFTAGYEFEYPHWLLYYRGKTLYSIFNSIFGWYPNNKEIFIHFNRIGIYPLDLIEKIKSL